MQQAEESKPAPAEPGSDEGRPGISPIKAFFVLAVPLLGLLLYALLSGSDDTPQTNGATRTEPAFALTDVEAIEVFEELHTLLQRAYRERDIALVKFFMAPDAPKLPVVYKEIRALTRDGVLDRGRTETKETDVVKNNPDEIVVRQVVIDRPKFVNDKTGEDVTVNAQPERQAILWTLRPYETEWKIFRSLIVEAGPVRK